MPTNGDKYIPVIDIGMSGPKATLVSLNGEVVASEFEETPLSLLPGGGAEQRSDDWWAAITTAVRKVLAQNVVPVANIAAVSCTSQYSSAVAVGRDGRPLVNAINWMGTRGAPYVRQITDGLIKYELSRHWDLIVIGGGITGTGILHEAARAGLQAPRRDRRSWCVAG